MDELAKDPGNPNFCVMFVVSGLLYHASEQDRAFSARAINKA